MKIVKARAVDGPDKPFRAAEITRRDLDLYDVLIEIKFAGICHSDIHTAHSEWGRTKYPLVPGHEIAGVVADVGEAVTKYKVGDRVGVGCMVDSCGECENCQKGEEQYCLNGNVSTYGGIDKYGEITQGGYSTHIVVQENFVLRIPDNIDFDVAAPLLCAGITTYSPLNHWKIGPGKKVAVIGLGGLGHMAVQIAHAMGAEVTVLSQTLNKKEDGLALGADHYYATKDPETFKKLARSFDFILNTVSAKIDLNAYLSLLTLDGTMVNVGAPAEPLAVNVFSLIGHRRSFAGSLIGGIRETQEMLDFCSEHNITPKIEVISADQIDEAYDRVLASDVKYRFVIDVSTM
ncbi:putative zinc-type alcohol dehydrogenase-like protein [Lysinibacillus composti]|uniref:NAD(P)-dependent alcohol dehydrogenase n=1 Tax=Lysinibacillus composti TaxID=720633 RepID=A0A3N9UCU7_9BACI|nr:NAD(P)-dependent alcohol dehydrogenase [Lysinibacillus composti]MBM7609110.1 putative zinc-type alcohol dehydrogenase-like protein [Lysinibacillus composti]RQW74170.1 NAD(P)-dependent alcohol dehydrogenase [Lysinibacillus composti]